MNPYPSIMSLSGLKSLFWGSEGHFEDNGVLVHFMDSITPSEPASNFLVQFKHKIVSTKWFQIASQVYLHTYIHEMGHALACKRVIPDRSCVYVHPKSGSTMGYFASPRSLNSQPQWKQSFVDAAGPLAQMAFSSLRLVAAVALRNYISWPVSFVLGAGAVYHMMEELSYAAESSVSGDGDFGSIASNSKMDLALASAALIGECALGILSALYFYK
jgi:hypothetical protein